MLKKMIQQSMESLQVTDPKLYRYIIQEMNDRHNIHSYDVEILDREEDLGRIITINYGENYAHSQEQFLTFETLNNRDDELVAFIQEVADDCKEVMIADYFKMHKP